MVTPSMIEDIPVEPQMGVTSGVEQNRTLLFLLLLLVTSLLVGAVYTCAAPPIPSLMDT